MLETTAVYLLHEDHIMESVELRKSFSEEHGLLQPPEKLDTAPGEILIT